MAHESPNIDEIFEAFLADQRERLSAKTFARYADVIELFCHSLDGYAYETLDPADRVRWDEAFEAGDEGAFCRLFGAQEIVGHLEGFLGYFMVRKVIAGEELLKAAGTVTKRLAGWLREQGHITDDQRRDAAERGQAASRDLPAADRLGALLHEEMQKTPVFDGGDVPDEHYIDDYLMIERVEPGVLWFEGGIGPLTVSEKATKIARPGWGVNIVLVMLNGHWYILELGSVYP